MDQEDVRLGETNIGLLTYVDTIVLLVEDTDQLTKQAKKF